MLSVLPLLPIDSIRAADKTYCCTRHRQLCCCRLLPLRHPDCSICGDGYTASPGFACNTCSDGWVGVLVAVVVAVVGVLLLVALLSHFLPAKDTPGRDIVTRVLRRVPVQSLKIVIIAWQILTQVCTCACGLKSLDGVPTLEHMTASVSGLTLQAFLPTWWWDVIRACAEKVVRYGWRHSGPP